MHARALLLIAITLGGCSFSDMSDWASEEAAGPEPINYRFVVANGLGAIVGGKEMQAERNMGTRILEISSPRRIDSFQGAVWMVCVRSLSYPARQPRGYYSVFIQREKIVSSRVAVGIDQCEREPYTPFNWSFDINNPIFQ